ncbi:MAG: hypothetical protein ACRCZ1_01025 [Cetobacterium sp.]
MKKLIMMGYLIGSLTTLSCDGVESDVNKLTTTAKKIFVEVDNVKNTTGGTEKRAVVVRRLEDELIEQLLTLSHIKEVHSEEMPQEGQNDVSELMGETKKQIKGIHGLY